MKKKEIEVDFMGGTYPLTKEEEKLITDYINARKNNTKHEEHNEQNRLDNKATNKTYASR